MPKPNKNESKQKFLSRCTQYVIKNEGKGKDQAYAVCNGIWDKSQASRAAMTLAMAGDNLRLEAQDGGDNGVTRTFLITAYTGEIISRWHDIVIDIGGIQSKQSFPILREHMRDRVVGQSNRAWAEDNRYYVSGELSQVTDDGQEVARLADEGFPWQASVSVYAKRIEVLEKDVKAKVNGREVTGPIDIWRETKLGEVSFVTLGADDNTAAIVLNENEDITGLPDTVTSTGVVWMDAFTKSNTEEKNMDFNIKKAMQEHPDEFQELTDTATKAGEKVGEERGRDAGVNAERERVAGIMAIEGDPAVKAKAIEDGLTVEAAYKLFFEAERKKNSGILDEMETEAPEHVGTETPKDPETIPKGKESLALATKARDLAKEKNIPITAALKEVARENPELTKAALPPTDLNEIYVEG